MEFDTGVSKSKNWGTPFFNIYITVSPMDMNTRYSFIVIGITEFILNLYLAIVETTNYVLLHNR